LLRENQHAVATRAQQQQQNSFKPHVFNLSVASLTTFSQSDEVLYSVRAGIMLSQHVFSVFSGCQPLPAEPDILVIYPSSNTHN